MTFERDEQGPATVRPYCPRRSPGVDRRIDLIRGPEMYGFISNIVSGNQPVGSNLLLDAQVPLNFQIRRLYM